MKHLMTKKLPTKNKQSRRHFLAASAGAAAAIGAGPAASIVSAQAPAALPDETTLVLTNGRIHTIDAGDAVVNTVSIRNGRFVAVGGRPPARAANVRVIDLKG